MVAIERFLILRCLNRGPFVREFNMEISWNKGFHVKKKNQHFQLARRKP